MESQNHHSVEENDNTNQNTPAKRATWNGNLEFLMSCIAMSVGLGNIWRFPFIANRNGGGAFLIPYLIVWLIIGRPLYYMEMILGQFASRGPAKMFYKFAPVLRGIGITQLIGSTCIASYYCSIMATTLFYLVNSFTNNFPWVNCSDDWNGYLLQRNASCIDTDQEINGQNHTINSAELYYRREVLKQKDDISDGIGYPEWRLSLCLSLSWLVTFLVTVSGVKSSGKASYFLAIFPYVVMFTLFIRSVTLPGSGDGILYFLETDFSLLLNIDVWYAAVTQCFFSLNIGLGTITTLASYNRFDHNIKRDALIVTTLDTLTSLLSGFTIFGILGNLAYEMKVDASEVVLDSGGAGLAFISYPNALSKFKFVPWLFAITFFVMLFVLGVGSLAATHVNLNSLVKDAFPKISDWKISATTAVCLTLVGLIYVTPGGQYTLDIVDFFGGTFVIYFGAICEVLVVTLLYGVENLCLDVEYMTKKKVGIYLRLTWSLLMPIMLVSIFIYFIIQLSPFVYGIDQLPLPIGLEVLGWGILAVSILQMISWLCYYLYKNRHFSGIQILVKTFTIETWGPDDPVERKRWKRFREQAELERSLQKGSWITKKIKNIIGR